jgi:hypothetical protein
MISYIIVTKNSIVTHFVTSKNLNEANVVFKKQNSVEYCTLSHLNLFIQFSTTIKSLISMDFSLPYNLAVTTTS